MSRSNITLIGMPGAGKSTVGVVVAKMLCKSFIDTDILIQQTGGARLFEIINEKGNDGFVALEGEVISSLDVRHTVIATGGSAVLSEAAMKHLKAISTVIYLRIPVESLAKRLGDLKCRGVVLGEGQTLEDLYAERDPLYEKYADVIIDSSNFSNIQTTAKKIIKKIDKKRAK